MAPAPARKLRPVSLTAIGHLPVVMDVCHFQYSSAGILDSETANLDAAKAILES